MTAHPQSFFYPSPLNCSPQGDRTSSAVVRFAVVRFAALHCRSLAMLAVDFSRVSRHIVPIYHLQGFARSVGGTPSSKLALRVHLLLASLTKSYKSLINAFILPFLRSPKSITSAPRSPRIIPDTRALNLN